MPRPLTSATAMVARRLLELGASSRPRLEPSTIIERSRHGGLVEGLRRCNAECLGQAHDGRRLEAQRPQRRASQRGPGHRRARRPCRRTGRDIGPSGRARPDRARRTRWRCPSTASSSSMRATASVPAGSSCPVGSSRTSTSVPIVTMLAIATRCCSPPDSANGARSARPPMPSSARAASMRASISARGTPRFSRPKASSSRTVSFDAESWLAGVEKTMPTVPARLGPPDSGCA